MFYKISKIEIINLPAQTWRQIPLPLWACFPHQESNRAWNIASRALPPPHLHYLPTWKSKAVQMTLSHKANRNNMYRNIGFIDDIDSFKYRNGATINSKSSNQQTIWTVHYLSNFASTSATITRLSMARLSTLLCSNKENIFLLFSIARPRINFSTTLTKTSTKKDVTFILICKTCCHFIIQFNAEILKWCPTMLINSITSLSLLLTSPAVVCELMDILQDPPPWQYTIVVISCLFSRAAISSWEGTYSLVFVFFRDSQMKWAYFSISVPG